MRPAQTRSALGLPLRRRRCVLAAALLWVPGAIRAQAARTVAEQAVVLERAALQRALSQRMAKAYLMQAQRIDEPLAGRILAEARETFERHLAWLKAASPSADATRQLGAVEARWAEFRAVLQRPPTRAAAAELYPASDELQAAAHAALLAFEAARPSPELRGLMLAGRLRMLGERMAKFWLYRHWGLNAAPADMELHLARAQFLALLVEVKKPLQGAEVTGAMATLVGNWPAYDRLLPADAGASPGELVLRSEQTFADAQALVRLMLEQAVQAAKAAPAAASAPR